MTPARVQVQSANAGQVLKCYKWISTAEPPEIVPWPEV